LAASKLTIRWAPSALRDLHDLWQYIAIDNEAAANKTIAHIQAMVDGLASHPYLGPMGRVLGTREMVILGTPFVVAYTVRGAEVDVVAVMHGARRWPEAF
jgi:addiction module RelE/StbE family toxin